MTRDFPPLFHKERVPFLCVISSPSGAGKTSLSQALVQRDPGLSLSVSMTTRPQRNGEHEGHDYFFVSRGAFLQAIEEKRMLEHATVFHHLYGTPRQAVEEKLAAGQDVLFDIDWQGARQLDAQVPQRLVRIFILPPSLEELQRRLELRKQDAPTIIDERMAMAKDEIEHWVEYDYVVVNDDFERAYGELSSIIQAERCRRTRYTISLAKTVK